MDQRPPSPPRTADVLVTGGSGYVGTPAVGALAAAGLDVVNLDRQAGGPGWRSGDVRDVPAGLAAPVVVHVAGLATGRGVTEAALFDVNVGGTRAVVAHAARTGARRVVLVSSIAVLGPSATPVDEDQPVGPRTAYGRSKLAAERVAATAADRAGIELVVVRPGYVLGPDHPGNFGRMVRAIARGRFVLPGRDDVLKAGIDRESLAALLAHLAVVDDPPPVVHAVLPDTPTTGWWTAALARELGGPPVRVAPEPVVRAGLAALDVVGAASPAARATAARVRKLRASTNVVSRLLRDGHPALRHDWVSAARMACAGVS